MSCIGGHADLDYMCILYLILELDISNIIAVLIWWIFATLASMFVSCCHSKSDCILTVLCVGLSWYSLSLKQLFLAGWWAAISKLLCLCVNNTMSCAPLASLLLIFFCYSLSKKYQDSLVVGYDIHSLTLDEQQRQYISTRDPWM